MDATQAAFTWIIDILEKNAVPFQIAGGLAARHYGSTRALHDIDIDIPEERFEALLPLLQSYTTYGPKRLKDRDWEIYLLTLDYQGQLIDLSGAHKTNVFDAKEGRWVRLVTDFDQVVRAEIFGRQVPIISKEALLQYKTILNRPQDREDLMAMQTRA